MGKYKIATKTDTLRYKIAKEVFGEIEDNDGITEIPSWQIFEKTLDLYKENTILKEALKEAEEIVRKTLDYYLHRMSFDDIQKDDLQYNYWSKKAKKCEDVIRVIEQAKESMK